MSDKNCYSIDKERWEESIDSIYELDDFEEGSEVDIFVGDEVSITHEEFFNAQSIIEDVQNRSHDEIGEWQDDYLEDIAKDEEKIRALQKLLIDFINDNAAMPSCFRVKNIKKIKHIV